MNIIPFIYFNVKAKRKKIKHNSINYFDLVCTLIIFLVMFIILASPKRYANGTIEGIKLFFFSVFPGLFPFMLLTKLLTEMGVIVKICSKLDKFSYKLFGTNGLSIYAFIMSIVSGYSIGAKIISDLDKKNLIDESEAKKMSVFCTTSGPIFIIGTVGSVMLGNFKYGIILYVSHILSSLLLGIIYGKLHKKETNFTAEKRNFVHNKPKNIVGFCINETINSLFVVGAYITIFFLIGELLDSLYVFKFIQNLLSPVVKLIHLDEGYLPGILYGILEVTRGAKTLSSTVTPISLILITGIISFSGLSIIFQSMAFLKEAKIKTHKFILTKFVHSIFSMLLSFLFIKLIL